MTLKVPLTQQDHFQGIKPHRLELVEYGDYQCPFCGRADLIVKRLQNFFKNDLYFIFRNFPLTEIHPQALDAAKVAEAAGKQGKFWQMHDVLFENQHDLDAESLLAYARALNLKIDQFVSDMNSPDVEEKIMTDFYGGVRSGVNGTPTFFINGFRHEGDWNYESLLGIFKNLLARVS